MEISNSLTQLMTFGLCIVASGLYSGAEAALVSIPIDHTRQLITQGGAKAHALKFMANHANELLTTLLVGNNLVNIFAASYATQIAQEHFKGNNAVAISVFITTCAILFFGEIMPKTFARNNGEKLIVPLVRLLQVNYYLFFPVTKLLTLIIRAILGKNAELNGNIVTKSDIEFMVNKAEKEKTIDSKQIDLLNSILEFPTIKVKDIMVPRQKVKSINIDTSFDDIINIFREDNHSRYPVCDMDLDNTVGFLHIKDLFSFDYKDKPTFQLKKWIKRPFFVYEHMKIQSVFDHMNRKKVHLALVKDETGSIVGIVTLEDIMEEIFGEIQDEHDSEEESVSDNELEQLGQEGVVVDGSLSLRDLHTQYKITIPLNDNYSTLAGFLLDMMGNNFPQQGNILYWKGLSFKLELVEEQVIKSIRITDIDGEKYLFTSNEPENDPTHNNNEES